MYKSNYKKLYEKFIEINKKGNILCPFNDSGGAGKLFENLLGKRFNMLSKPDFNDIEIKVRNHKSTYPISLFGFAPQIKHEKYKLSMKYLGENYAVKKENSNIKYFSVDINGKRFTKYKYGYSFKLKVNYIEKKIYLIIIDDIYLIKTNIYWNFNGLEKRLTKKMQKLAIVGATVTIFDNQKYCYYDDIEFYYLRDIKYFFYLIERGLIVVSFNIKVENDIVTYDTPKFRIKYEDIEKLYYKLNIRY